MLETLGFSGKRTKMPQPLDARSLATPTSLRLLTDDDISHILSSTDNFWQNLIQSLENIALAARRLRENIENSVPLSNHSFISEDECKSTPDCWYLDEFSRESQYYLGESLDCTVVDNAGQYKEINSAQKSEVNYSLRPYREEVSDEAYFSSHNKNEVASCCEDNKRTSHPIMGKVALMNSRERRKESPRRISKIPLEDLRRKLSKTYVETNSSKKGVAEEGENIIDCIKDRNKYKCNDEANKDSVNKYKCNDEANKDTMSDVIYNLVKNRFQSKLEQLRQRSMQRKKKRPVIVTQSSITEDSGGNTFKTNTRSDSLYSSISEGTCYSRPWGERFISDSGTYEEYTSYISEEEVNNPLIHSIYESFVLVDSSVYNPVNASAEMKERVSDPAECLQTVDTSLEERNQYDESQVSKEVNVGSPGQATSFYENWPTPETNRSEEYSPRSTARSLSPIPSRGSSDLSALVSNSRSTNNGNEDDNRICSATKQQDLMSQLKVQDERLKQTLKAIDYCRSKNIRRWSIRNLEVQKILLLESYKREVINLELAECRSDQLETSSCGSITFSDLKLSCREHSIQYDSTESIMDTTEYFVCIMSYRTDVLISEITTASSDKTVCFKKVFRFDRLPVDFEIDLCVFSTKTKVNEEPKLLCPTSLSKLLRLRSQRRYNIASKESTVPSVFKLCGRRTIRRRNLGQNELALFDTPISCSLQGNISFKMESRVQFFNSLSDFINIGSFVKGVISWNRYWCLLEDCKIKYWTYPPEWEEMPPIGVIDLERTASSQISEVSRKMCPRPRTLFLKIADGQECSCYFLSMNSMEMLKRWKNELNLIIRTLKDWNCLKS